MSTRLARLSAVALAAIAAGCAGPVAAPVHPAAYAPSELGLNRRPLLVIVRDDPAALPPGAFARAIVALLPSEPGFPPAYRVYEGRPAEVEMSLLVNFDHPGDPSAQTCASPGRVAAPAAPPPTRVVAALCRRDTLLASAEAALDGPADPEDPAFRSAVRSAARTVFVPTFDADRLLYPWRRGPSYPGPF